MVGVFLDEYLHPRTADPESKLSVQLDHFAAMDQAGYFFPVFLQELDFLGSKVFGGRRDDQIIKEVNDLIAFLHRLSQRLPGDEENDLEFCREYCKVGIVIVGKSWKTAEGARVWVNFIKKTLIPQDIETIYLVGPIENREVMEKVCEEVDEFYTTCRTHVGTVRLAARDGKLREKEQYLAILRSHQASIIQPSR